MPINIATDIKHTDFGTLNIDYDYPNGLNLKPGSDIHDYIRDEILKRAGASALAMSNRHSSWNSIDKVLTTYIDLSAEEEAIKEDDDRKPVSIVFPYSYAIMETVLSYLMAAFYQQPIFRYEGTSPEDTVGAIMMEKVIDIHCNKSKVPLALHTMFRDSLSYGFGNVACGWDKQWGMKTVKEENGFFSQVSGLFKGFGSFRKETEETILFEGNELTNIDPYLCLPDPNVSIHEVQKGEFFGWLDNTNYMDKLSGEQFNEDVFNVKYLESVHNKRTSIYSSDHSAREAKHGSPIREDSTVTNRIDDIYMYIKLIPKEWKLGENEYPEKWLFCLSADEVITEARPIGLNHGMYPVAVSAPDFDGYSSTPISRLETLQGLQGVLDWLFNMHIANVRKSINDMIVYDPYLINSNDLKRPSSEGKLIRTRRPAWGRGVKDAVQQLMVTDVTKQHIADSSWIVQWMQKIGAADDAAMGSLRQGGPERLTGTEFQGTKQGAFSRLGRVAQVIGLQAMQDIGYMFASHTQQLMDNDLYVKATGRWQQVLMDEYGANIKKGRMKVTPFDLLVDYDLIVRDGSIPGGNYSGVWERMFEHIGKYPELMQQFDSVRIFKHIARNNGAKNADDFVKIKVQSNEQIEQNVDKGNLVNMEEFQGGAG